MTPEEVAAAVQVEAEALDLVVGPVVRDGYGVQVYLSAAHESGGTAIIESNGVERFSLYLEQFHWPEFAYQEADQREVISKLARLAAFTCSGAPSSGPNGASGAPSGWAWRSLGRAGPSS